MSLDGAPLVRLGDVVDVNPERVREDDQVGIFRYVDIASVSSDLRAVVGSEVKELDWGSAPSRAQRRLRSGDILVSTVRPYLRGLARVESSEDGAVGSTGFAVLRATDRVDEDFLWGVVQSEAFLAHLVARQTGSNYPAVRPSDVEDFEFRLAGLDEQRELGTRVKAAHRAVTLARRHVSNLDALRAAYRRQAFQRLEGSREVALSSLGTFARGGSFPRAEQGARDGDHPVFKVADMNTAGNERYLREPENWVTEDQKERLKMKLWPAGTTVFARVGAALTGDRRRLLVRPSILDDNMLGITPNEKLVRPYFLMLALEQLPLASMAQQGAVPSINAKMVGALAVALPTLHEQAAIEELVQAVDRARAEGAEHVLRLATLNAAVANAALTMHDSAEVVQLASLQGAAA